MDDFKKAIPVVGRLAAIGVYRMFYVNKHRCSRPFQEHASNLQKTAADPTRVPRACAPGVAAAAADPRGGGFGPFDPRTTTRDASGVEKQSGERATATRPSWAPWRPKAYERRPYFR